MQTYPSHPEEEPQNTNSHKTSGKQLKQNNQLSLPLQDDCKTRKDTQKCIAQQRPNTERTLTMGVHKMNQQQQNHSLKMDSSVPHLGA